MLKSLHSELADTGTVQFTVRIVPSAAQSQISEILDDESIKIRIAAPAEKGKANEELIKLLSREFGILKQSITIISGAQSKHKLIRITR